MTPRCILWGIHGTRVSQHERSNRIATERHIDCFTKIDNFRDKVDWWLLKFNEALWSRVGEVVRALTKARGHSAGECSPASHGNTRSLTGRATRWVHLQQVGVAPFALQRAELGLGAGSDGLHALCLLGPLLVPQGKGH